MMNLDFLSELCELEATYKELEKNLKRWQRHLKENTSALD